MNGDRIALGALSMCGAYGVEDHAGCVGTLRTAASHGVAWIDTADYYLNGAHESLVHDVLGESIQNVRISGKTGIRPDPNTGLRLDGSPEYLRRACERSLTRLGVDRLDLYTLAWVDPAVPIEESVGAMADLRSQGKIGAIGLSDVSDDTLRRAAATTSIDTMLGEVSLWERSALRERDTLRELDISLWAYAPLGRGFLTGTVSGMHHLDEGDWRHNFPRFQAEEMRGNLPLLGPVRAVADSHGRSMAQVALAWVGAQDEVDVAMPGTKNPHHLADLLEAFQLTLGAEDLAVLESSFPSGSVEGHRYAPMVAQLLDTEY